VTYDLIVVGGGPAGATCARRAAQLGLDVLVLERVQHPRRKACGGGITVRVRDLLDFDLTRTVERQQYGIRLYSPSGLLVEHSSSESSGFTVRRETFDVFLLEKAKDAGAAVVERTRVTDVVEGPDSVIARTEEGDHRGRLLVGADGVNSTVARRTGLRQGWRSDDVGLCIEASVPMDPSEIVRIVGERALLETHFGPVLYGYGWAFAKRSEFSLGIGTRVSRIQDLKGAWRKFIAEFEKRHSVRCDLSQATSARLPLSGRIENTCSKRIMLVGDAAGFVAPVTGEGIYYAVRSGRAAADIAHDVLSAGPKPDCKPYEMRCKSEFGADLAVARWLSRMLLSSNKRMEVVCQAAHSDPVVRQCIMELAMGMKPYPELRNRMIKRLLWKHPRRAVSLFM
jgi:geranylgeranyl reductase family protein